VGRFALNGSLNRLSAAFCAVDHQSGHDIRQRKALACWQAAAQQRLRLGRSQVLISRSVARVRELGEVSQSPGRATV
jgi:hypothetical protein